MVKDNGFKIKHTLSALTSTGRNYDASKNSTQLSLIYSEYDKAKLFDSLYIYAVENFTDLSITMYSESGLPLRYLSKQKQLEHIKEYIREISFERLFKQAKIDSITIQALNITKIKRAEISYNNATSRIVIDVSVVFK